MKYIDEFRDGSLARRLGAAIAREVAPGRRYNLMEFCGGHTHAISRYGLTDLLPAGINMIHGPGCPVCVLPIGRIDSAIALAARPGLILCTYADTMRVPASQGLSLMKAKARGADIRMVYSSADALAIAKANPEREVVFFAIGFETTTPPTAVAIRAAAAEGLANFSVFCNHVLTPAAISNILEAKDVREIGTVPIDGFIGPAHVSTVIGSEPYEYFADEYQKPVVIAGFEPLDVMQAILMLVRQLNEGRAEVENEFTRAVTREGNVKAKALVAEVFELRRSFEWRGLGEVPYSALAIKEAYAAFDAERRYAIGYRPVPDHKACECGAILRGAKKPTDCKVLGTACTPENPIGSCMVSSEGACAAHYTYGRFKDVPVVAKAVHATDAGDIRGAGPSQAANCSPAGGSAAATAASVGAHQPWR
jgi:hydrogenase expression/formation protein HypD